MRDYYEAIGVASTASTTEIEAVCDEKYNKWRRLVTHHDPNIVEKATRSLRVLEQIRTALTDPGKRAAYDVSIGIGGVVGGLSDPGALPHPGGMGVPTHTLPRPVTPVPFSGSQVDAWICNKCQAVNATGSVFCKSCGNQIGQKCPNCDTIFESTAGFCPSCGTNPEELRRQAARAQAEAGLKLQRTIQVRLEQARSHLQAKQYRLVREALVGFEGLGAKSGKSETGESAATICQRDRPEWRGAKALVENADVVKKELIKQMLPYAAGGYAFVGLLVGLLIYEYFEGAIIGLVAGAILGAVGPSIYYNQWGGRSSLGQDQVLAALTPLGIALGLALAASVIWVIIVIVVIIIVIMILAGGG